MSEYKNGGNNNMLWEQGVAGSNPATPTQKTKELQKCDSFFYLHKIMVEMVVFVHLFQPRSQPMFQPTSKTRCCGGEMETMNGENV